MRIFLLRHGEAMHNIIDPLSPTWDWHLLPDPFLTPTGTLQAASLLRSLPAFKALLDHTPKHKLGIATSPLRRTLQTTLLAFSAILPPLTSNEAVKESENGNGSATGEIKNGAVDYPTITILPQLQECGAHPCDTGLPLESTKKLFDLPYLDFGEVEKEPEWNTNTGFYEATLEKQDERGRWIRNWIRDREREGTLEVLVVVAHHGILRSITRTPKAGTLWPNAELREYRFADAEEGDKEALLERIWDAQG